MRSFIDRLLPKAQDADISTPGPYLHMFLEDVHASIMPYRNSRDPLGLSATFEGSPSDIRTAETLCRSLSRFSHSGKDSLELVSDAVRSVAQHLVWQGRAAYELLEVSETKEAEPDGRVFRARALTRERQIRLPGRTVGIPRRYAGTETEAPWATVRPSKNVWIISIPRSLGGISGHRRRCTMLERYPLSFPRWALQAMARENHKVRFEVRAYSRLKHAYVSAASGEFYWGGRNNSLDYQTEFFLFYRTIEFHRALAILRLHIVAEINALFANHLRIDARIELAGFRTPREIVEIRDKMTEGQMSFGDAYERVRF